MDRFVAEPASTKIWAILILSLALHPEVVLASITGIGGIIAEDEFGFEVSSDPDTWGPDVLAYVGTDSEGLVSINGGSAMRTFEGHLGLGATGGVIVDGAGSTWTNENDLIVGESQSGSLSVAAGGSVANRGNATLGSMEGTSGSATIDGSGSTWTNRFNLFVGSRGYGELSISDGGAVSGAFVSSIGSGPTGVGLVSVSGADSTWSTRWLDVGGFGDGTLSIRDGGGVTIASRTQVAERSGSTGQIAFDSGTLTTTDLYAASVDLTGVGTIHTSGLVTDINLTFNATHGLAQTLVLDQIPDQHVTIHLNANGEGSLGAGYAGVGELSISDGTSIASTYGLFGARHGAFGSAQVIGPGSVWDIGIDLRVGDAGDGRLSITDGGVVTSDTGYVASRETSVGQVSVDGAGSSWTNRQRLSVGTEGAGLLSITGGGTVSAGDVFVIDFDTNGDSFVNMATGGMLALSGDAAASLAQFFDLIEGTDAIRFWDDSLSDWALLTDATYGEDYTLEYLTDGDLAGYTLLTVGVAPTLPGDYNVDGRVDAADYTVWRDADGGATLPNDSTPGTVDQHDYDVWLANFGTTAALAVSTPEPASALLVLIAVVGAPAARGDHL